MNFGVVLAETAVGTDLGAFLESIKGGLTDFNVTNLGTILLAAMGIVVPLVLAWFGYRWVARRASKALHKGSL